MTAMNLYREGMIDKDEALRLIYKYLGESTQAEDEQDKEE